MTTDYVYPLRRNPLIRERFWPHCRHVKAWERRMLCAVVMIVTIVMTSCNNDNIISIRVVTSLFTGRCRCLECVSAYRWCLWPAGIMQSPPFVSLPASTSTSNTKGQSINRWVVRWVDTWRVDCRSVHNRMDGCMNGYINEPRHYSIDGWMDVCTDGRTNGLTDWWIDSWI